MREGYWLNYATGFDVRVPDHEIWVRNPENAQALGIPESVMEEFPTFTPVEDRERFLIYLLKTSPIVRIRGHGTQISFEYAAKNSKDAIESIFLWAKRNAGPYSQIYIANLQTGETTAMLFKDFEELMNTGGYDAVMRRASKMSEESLTLLNAMDLLNRRLVGMKVNAKDIIQKRAVGEQFQAYIKRALSSLEMASRLIATQPAYFRQEVENAIRQIQYLIDFFDIEGWEPMEWTAQEEDTEDLGMGVSDMCRMDRHEQCQSYNCECRCHGYEPEP